MSFEERSGKRLDEDVNAQIGPPIVKRLKRRQREHYIANRSQTNDQNVRIAREIRQQRRRCFWIGYWLRRRIRGLRSHSLPGLLARISLTRTRSGNLRHAIKRFGNDFVNVVQLLPGDDVRRKNIDNIAQRSEQHAFVEIEIVERGTQF
jgi:hypothetical protein